jgi:hypothetical protein
VVFQRLTTYRKSGRLFILRDMDYVSGFHWNVFLAKPRADQVCYIPLSAVLAQGYFASIGSLREPADTSLRLAFLLSRCFANSLEDERTFEKVRKMLFFRPGDQHNENLACLWKNSRLTPDNSVRDRVKLDVNENVGTVVMTCFVAVLNKGGTSVGGLERLRIHPIPRLLSR